MTEYLGEFQKKKRELELGGEELTQFLLFLVQKRLVDVEAKLGKVENELDYLSTNVRTLNQTMGEQ